MPGEGFDPRRRWLPVARSSLSGMHRSLRRGDADWQWNSDSLCYHR